MDKIITNLFPIVLIFVLCSFAFAQTKEISQRNKELSSLKTEIKQLQTDFESKSQKERQSLKALENLNQQNMLLSKLIINLQREEKSKEREIEGLNSQIQKTETTIAEIKKSYSNYIVWLYKSGIKNSELKFLLDSDSFNEAILRYKYLSYFTEKNKNAVEELKIKRQELTDLNIKLNGELEAKRVLISQRKEEQKSLTDSKKQKENILSKLRKDKRTITKEIEEKRQYEEKIKNIIAKLVEESQKLAENKTEKESAFIRNYSYDKFENFINLKGKLNWPVNSGKVVRKFGENKHRTLKTVTLNYGVDIRTKKDAEVYAVAQGIVSAIDWIPGYGSVIIITHKGEFRTVYGHLYDISVTEGDEVMGGTPLGKANESLEGNIIHFEIWQERNNQNPETWLVSR